jgi:hypothetical protein
MSVQLVANWQREQYRCNVEKKVLKLEYSEEGNHYYRYDVG